MQKTLQNATRCNKQYWAYFTPTAFFLGLLQTSPIWWVGTVSPSSFPQGFKPFMWSKMIFITAINGIDRNMPDSPHSAFPSNTITMDTSALICTLDETILGTKILLSINCI